MYISYILHLTLIEAMTSISVSQNPGICSNVSDGYVQINKLIISWLINKIIDNAFVSGKKFGKLYFCIYMYFVLENL